MDSPKISIAGCGFVGLVTAASLASKGFKVIGTTLVEEQVDLINKGEAPFFEEGLNAILKEAVELGNLFITTDNTEAVINSDITLICVGTPMRDDNSIDLNYIDSVSQEIGIGLREKSNYHLVVDRSTVVPGTTRNIIGKNLEEKSGRKLGVDIGLCMQPEFIREGSSVYDTFSPNRIVIGEFDKKSGDLLEDFWIQFYGEPHAPILRMNIESAEMVKYANNCLLSTKISFANEFSNFAELIPNVDIVEVMKGVGLDDRISPKFLRSGVGFGGSCFHKDVSAIKEWAKSLGFESVVLKAVLELNDFQALHMVNIAEDLARGLKDKRITLLGLSFKPGTDDMREAASIRVINELLKRNVKEIIGFDPKANKAAEKELGDKIQYANSIEEALKDSECAFLITEWDEFKSLTPDDFKKHMKTPNLVDGRRIFPYEEFKSKLPFRAMGRKN